MQVSVPAVVFSTWGGVTFSRGNCLIFKNPRERFVRIHSVKLDAVDLNLGQANQPVMAVRYTPQMMGSLSILVDRSQYVNLGSSFRSDTQAISDCFITEIENA